jgi:hypothetical protein
MLWSDINFLEPDDLSLPYTCGYCNNSFWEPPFGFVRVLWEDGGTMAIGVCELCYNALIVVPLEDRLLRIRDEYPLPGEAQ